MYRAQQTHRLMHTTTKETCHTSERLRLLIALACFLPSVLVAHRFHALAELRLAKVESGAADAVAEIVVVAADVQPKVLLHLHALRAAAVSSVYVWLRSRAGEFARQTAVGSRARLAFPSRARLAGLHSSEATQQGPEVHFLSACTRAEEKHSQDS